MMSIKNINYTILIFISLVAGLGLAKKMKLSDEVAAGRALFIDVREFEEVRPGILKEGVWLPMSALESNSARYQGILKGLKKDKKLYIYCRSGGRAGRAVKHFQKLGYKAENVGGYAGLKSRGIPTEPVTLAKPKTCPWRCGK